MNWEEVELNNVCQIENGFAFKSKDYLLDGVPLVRISNFNNGDVIFDHKSAYLDKSFLSAKSDFIVTKGDVVIALSGATTGKYGIYSLERPALLNQRIGILKYGSSTEMDDRFFYHYLGILQKEIFRKAGGAAQPNISTKEIGKLKIPLPPLPTQKKIAAILDAADNYRQKTKALIDKYDQLTQSIFLDMFGDPVRNEKGWDVEKLGDVTVNLDSKRIPVKQADRDLMKELYPYYGATGVIDLVDNFTHEGQLLLIAEDGKALVNRNKPIAFMAEGKYWVNNHSHVIDKTDVLNLRFLEYQFRLLKIRKFVTGIDQYKLNRSNMDRIPIILPPIEKQISFSNCIENIIETTKISLRQIKKSEQLFQSLLQKAFKGELIK